MAKHAQDNRKREQLPNELSRSFFDYRLISEYVFHSILVYQRIIVLVGCCLLVLSALTLDGIGKFVTILRWAVLFAFDSMNE